MVPSGITTSSARQRVLSVRGHHPASSSFLGGKGHEPVAVQSWRVGVLCGVLCARPAWGARRRRGLSSTARARASRWTSVAVRSPVSRCSTAASSSLVSGAGAGAGAGGRWASSPEQLFALHGQVGACAPPGDGDVECVARQCLVDEYVGGVDGAALGAGGCGGVSELDVWLDVAAGESDDALGALLGADREVTVSVYPFDGPGVAVFPQEPSSWSEDSSSHSYFSTAGPPSPRSGGTRPPPPLRPPPSGRCPRAVGRDSGGLLG